MLMLHECLKSELLLEVSVCLWSSCRLASHHILFIKISSRSSYNKCLLSQSAASPQWTAVQPSAPDTWAATAPPCRSSRRTRSPASVPRPPHRPAGPLKRRGWSCRQVRWVSPRTSHHETESFPRTSRSHTGDLCNINYWFTCSSSKCLLWRHCKREKQLKCDPYEEDWRGIHVSCKCTRNFQMDFYHF